MQHSAKSLLLEFTFSIFLLSLLSSSLTIYSSHAQTTESFSSSSSSECITYNPEEKVIIITCKSATLTDINNQLNDPDILHKETANDGVWLLNAGIMIEQDATLYINSTDTSWMKIAADGQTAYPILVSGSLKIDSWN